MTHLTTAEAAQRLRVKPQTLRMWRLKGGGPPFCRVSANRCTYPEAELATWEQARIYRSTAEEHAGRRPAEGIYVCNVGSDGGRYGSLAPVAAESRWPVSLANARLIAAAPDLLRVLTAAEHALRAYEFGNADPSLARQVADAAKVVLDKAEGR